MEKVTIVLEGRDGKDEAQIYHSFENALAEIDRIKNFADKDSFKVIDDLTSRENGRYYFAEYKADGVYCELLIQETGYED